ncbi:hypothetical protein E4U21_005855 [Claviceps maximensis]|nr:hypothetical protein E4U21_005855 [Claviceps maximensis]
MAVVSIPAARLAELFRLLHDASAILERARRDLDSFPEKQKRVVALINNEMKQSEAADTANTEMSMDMDVDMHAVVALYEAAGPAVIDALETGISAAAVFRARVFSAVRGSSSTLSGAGEHLALAPALALADKDEHVSTAAATGSMPYALRYHADVRAMQTESPRLFMPWPQPDSSGACGSRRVVLGGLPPDTNTRQVLCAVGRCDGGVVSVVVADDPTSRRRSRGPSPSPSPGSCRTRGKTALVEFAYPHAAADFASRTRAQPLAVRDRSGTAHVVPTSLVATPSWHMGELTRGLLRAGATRALCMPGFPVGAVWHLLTTLGSGVISRVEAGGVAAGADKDDAMRCCCLTVEFVSLWAAHRAEQLLRGRRREPGRQVRSRSRSRSRTRFRYDADANHMRYTADSSQLLNVVAAAAAGADDPARHSEHKDVARLDTRMHVSDDFTRGPACSPPCTPYMHPDALARTWNQQPYNTVRAGTPPPAWDRPALMHAPPGPPSPSSAGHHPHNQIHDDDDDTHAPACTTHYKIIGSTITLTRHPHSWSITHQDDLKLHMANTLHDPDWADHWDAYFSARGAVNLRRWERYGMLAAHRRRVLADRASTSALDSDPRAARGSARVPRCEPGCGWPGGCRALGETAVADVVRTWCSRR